MSRIRVLVSDLGKVLLPFDVQRVWDALDPHFECPPEAARAAVQQLFRETRFGRGGVSGREFYRRLAERTGLRLPYEAFRVVWSDMFWEDPAVIRLVREAPVEKRYLLSNTNVLHWEFILERYPHVMQIFDGHGVSHELGLEKPDPAIYEWVIRQSGFPPEAHLFVDDVEENVAAARAVGMHGVVHRDSHSLWEEFVRRGLAREEHRPNRSEVVVATPEVQALWDVEPPG